MKWENYVCRDIYDPQGELFEKNFFLRTATYSILTYNISLQPNGSETKCESHKKIVNFGPPNTTTTLKAEVPN